MSTSHNVLKTLSATLNFYFNTKTLQIQGKASGELRNRLLDVYNVRMRSCHLDNTSSEEDVNDADRHQTASTETTAQARSPDENVLFSEFSKEIGKIWPASHTLLYINYDVQIHCTAVFRLLSYSVRELWVGNV